MLLLLLDYAQDLLDLEDLEDLLDLEDLEDLLDLEAQLAPLRQKGQSFLPRATSHPL